VNDLPVFCCQTGPKEAIILSQMVSVQKKVDNHDNDAELNAEIAKRVMGWKNVHRQDRLTYIGKKQDKIGHWRTAKVPDYLDLKFTSQIEERLKQLGLLEKYTQTLTKIAQSEGLPEEWATPKQRCRAALKTMKSKKDGKKRVKKQLK
jgi:hypothetical protein